jgi:hypothetical protein
VYELSVEAYSPNGILTDHALAAHLADARQDGDIPENLDVPPDRVREMAPLRAVLKELGLGEQ